MADELLSSKELAASLKRHLTYVQAMRRKGFRMHAYRATLHEALRWLDRHPHPRGHANARPRMQKQSRG